MAGTNIDIQREDMNIRTRNICCDEMRMNELHKKVRMKENSIGG